MDREESADPVAGAMSIIDPRLPQRAPREAVELRPARSLGKQRRGDRDMTLEHPREAVAHFVGWFADSQRAGDIGRAVLILPARIDQIERVELNWPVGLG